MKFSGSATLSVALFVAVAATGFYQEGKKDIAPFGFSGVEFYKLERGARNLVVKDIDGDGLKDVVIVNNAKATIDFFIQKSKAEMERTKGKSEEKLQINELADDARFKREKLLTEKHIYGLVVDDLNNDKMADIAYIGDPPELVVVYRGKSGWSSDQAKFPIEKISGVQSSIAAGDLNGDGLTDLVVLGATCTYILYQDKDGKLAPPQRIANHAKDISAMWLCDINGDKRKDILYIVPNSTKPVAVRLQGEKGIGDVVAYEFPQLATVDTFDLDQDGADELITISANTGRLNVHKWEKGESLPTDADLHLLPFKGGAESKRGVTIVDDIDGDGIPDIVSTLPETAQISVVRRKLDGSTTDDLFPTLSDISSAAIADIDGDGKKEMIVASMKEKVLGIGSWGKDGLQFPKTKAVENGIVCMTCGKVSGGKGAEIVYVTKKDGDGLLHIASSDFKELVAIPLPKTIPDKIAVVDADQDGRNDIFLFVPYEPMTVLLNVSEKGGLPAFVDIGSKENFQKGLLQDARYSSFSTADLDGDGKAEFILAKQNFARAMRIDKEGAIEIVRQYNLESSSAKVAGAAAIDIDGDKKKEVLLLDESGNKLVILREREGKTEVANTIDVSAVKAKEMYAADISGDGKPDIVLLSDDLIAIVQPGFAGARLKNYRYYEWESAKGHIVNFSVGDLNGDKRPDVVIIEATDHLMLIAVNGADPQLQKAIGFKMFEGKSYERSGQFEQLSEPREIVIDDVTGDGKNDIVMLIHDRLIVYPQE